MNSENRNPNNKEKCPYCDGKGYFQVILGGSETCEVCQGHGVSDKLIKLS